MFFEVNFRCHYKINWPEDILIIKGYRSKFNSDGTEVVGREMKEVETTVSYFIKFCTLCIASEQGTNKDIELSKYGIRYDRETFDDRYFYTDELQICVGEVYIMYEILKRKINPNRLKMYTFADRYYIFISRDRYLLISDKPMLNVGFFRYDLLDIVNFTVDDKVKGGYVGYDTRVSIGNIQKAWLERGACHPYVNLTYRDMTVNMSLREFNTLRNVLSGFEHEDFEI